ncbi:MAG: DUF1579 domain-containing protein [Planctomycetes bacterium]|nr:DUF1579 domain-containing protein [Planctomycetota bacterium]
MTTSQISTLKYSLAAWGASLILAGQLAAQEQQDEWKIEPTAQHKILKKDVGTWDAQVKIWPMPDAEPMESKGVEKNRLLEGGLWLITRFEGEVIGTPFVGMGTFGYDPAEKKYIGTWVDTMTPHLMITKSDYDEKTKTMTGIAETRDPMTGKKYNAKMISRYNDDGTRVMEMHRKGADGQEWKVMEISYQRRADKTTE